MTPEQKEWLRNNPAYSPPTFLGVVSAYAWTDEKWLLGNGNELPEEPKYAPFMRGVFSSGDTLYAAQPVLHVARKVAIF